MNTTYMDKFDIAVTALEKAERAHAKSIKALNRALATESSINSLYEGAGWINRDYQNKRDSSIAARETAQAAAKETSERLITARANLHTARELNAHS